MLTLAHLRQIYKPSLPSLFADLSNVVFTRQNHKEVKGEIQNLFPLTSNQPTVESAPGKAGSCKPLKIGVVFSGGQAPGGHNVVTGLFDAMKALNSESRLWGFLDGPSGIVSGKVMELTDEILSPYRNQGGFDLLGSGRTKIETDEQLQGSLKTAKNLGLDGIVIIGGDDSNTNAAVIAEFFLKNQCATKVIGVPKTIDGDLQNPYVSISFGFDTATKIYSELIGNVARDALSAKKYYHFIKVMGRSASHIALECALKAHPNLTLISEERQSLSEITNRICDLIEKRAADKKNYGVIVIPEGLIEYMSDVGPLIADLGKMSPETLPAATKATWDVLPTRVQQQLLLEKDPHGNINLSGVETELLLIDTVTKELQKRNFQGKFSPLPHFFGYEGRAGLPSNFDANYCYALGYAAALLVAHGFTSYMAFVGPLLQPPKEWKVGGLPLTSQLEIFERKGKMKPAIAKAYVDLKGKPYLELQKKSDDWAMKDDYQMPGPIQFFGEVDITDSLPLILQC